MPTSAYLLPVLVPLMFWGAYHYYHDRHRPEPIALLLLCIALGVAAFFLARGMYIGLGFIGLRLDAYALAANREYIALLSYAVLVIGLAEELAKLLPFVLLVVHFKHFDEPLDSIVYGSFIALGFALAENVGYMTLLSAEHAIARGFAGPLIHIVFASIWAYFVGRAFLTGAGRSKAIVFGLALAALLHGVYDFIAIGFADGALVAGAALVLGIWLWRLKLIRRLATEAHHDA